MKKDNIILSKSLDFAVEVVILRHKMIEEKEYVLSKQLLRCGTSIGANIELANGAMSKIEFTSYMNISLKEAKESRYWLRLIKQSQIVNTPVDKHLKDIDDIVNILSAIVKTSKENNE